MKRKKLLEFADYLERSRKPFDITDARHCVSMQACRFNGDVDKRGMVHRAYRPAELCSSHQDLMRIFDLDGGEANKLFAGFDWRSGKLGHITRKVAASVVRGLARTGKVRWGKFADNLAADRP